MDDRVNSTTKLFSVGSRLKASLPLCVAIGFVCTTVAVGYRSGWVLPRFSTLVNATKKLPDDWCAEHNVAESICIECRSTLAGQLAGSDGLVGLTDKKARRFGWCAKHGVGECPHCFPLAAELPTPLPATKAELERITSALEFAPRVSNSRLCKLPERRLQIASPEVMSKLGVSTQPAVRGQASEWLQAPAESAYDPTLSARVSARAEGVVVAIFVEIGDKVRAGQVLAFVDAAEVGRAKSEYHQAVVDEEFKFASIQSLRGSGGGVAGMVVREAEAAAAEAHVRTLTAGQALGNLGLPFEELRGLSVSQLAERLKSLGLPNDAKTSQSSSNLISVKAPLDGEVVSRSVAPGESTTAGKPLFVVADVRRLWINLSVRSEDVDRLKTGQAVYFTHDGHESSDAASITWISPIADERSRTIPARAELANRDGQHRAGSFGSARILLREDPRAVLVPTAAVHWEGDCHVVFVRDRNFDQDDSTRVFHVRQVRPGAKDFATTTPMTEIAAGLLPGELVAVQNSGLFRSELLKNNLGAG